jgi:hypothetical protein
MEQTSATTTEMSLAVETTRVSWKPWTAKSHRYSALVRSRLLSLILGSVLT